MPTAEKETMLDRVIAAAKSVFAPKKAPELVDETEYRLFKDDIRAFDKFKVAHQTPIPSSHSSVCKMVSTPDWVSAPGFKSDLGQVCGRALFGPLNGEVGISVSAVRHDLEAHHEAPKLTE